MPSMCLLLFLYSIWIYVWEWSRYCGGICVCVSHCVRVETQIHRFDHGFFKRNCNKKQEWEKEWNEKKTRNSTNTLIDIWYGIAVQPTHRRIAMIESLWWYFFTFDSFTFMWQPRWMYELHTCIPCYRLCCVYIDAYTDAGTGISIVCTRFIYIFDRLLVLLLPLLLCLFEFYVCVSLFLTAAKELRPKFLLHTCNLALVLVSMQFEATAQPSIERTRCCQFQVDRE